MKQEGEAFPNEIARLSQRVATVQITWMKLYVTLAAIIGRKQRGSVYAPLDSPVFAICILADMRLLYSAAQRPTWGLPRTLGRNAVFLAVSLSPSLAVAILPFLSPISLFAFSIDQHNYRLVTTSRLSAEAIHRPFDEQSWFNVPLTSFSENAAR